MNPVPSNTSNVDVNPPSSPRPAPDSTKPKITMSEIKSDINTKVGEAKQLMAGLFNEFTANQQLKDKNWMSEYQLKAKQSTMDAVEDSLNAELKAQQRNFNQVQRIHMDAVATSKSQDKLIEKRNDKLEKQQDQLKLIENEIQTKDRLTVLNKESLGKKNLCIWCLSGFAIVMGIMIIPFALYLMNTMSFHAVMVMFVCLLVLATIACIWKVKSVQDPAKLHHTDERIPKKPQTDFCDCDGVLIPRDIEQTEDQSTLDAITDPNANPTQTGIQTADHGFYYYDGTAPPQDMSPQGLRERPQITWEVSESEKYAFRPVQSSSNMEPEAQETNDYYNIHVQANETIKKLRGN